MAKRPPSPGCRQSTVRNNNFRVSINICLNLYNIMKNLYGRCIAVSLFITFAASVLTAGESTNHGVGTGLTAGSSGSAAKAGSSWKTSSITRSGAAASAMTPLESSLALWRKGDKSGAIEKFLQIDWTKNSTAFQQGSPLSTREQDLPKMSDGDREVLMREVNAQLKDLKQLAAAVREKALATADKTVGRRHLAKLDECGAALDQPDALLILKLTGRSIRKMAVSDAGTPGK
jgi:hypothetical protein